MRPVIPSNAAATAVQVLAGIEEAELSDLDLSDVPDGPPDIPGIAAEPWFPTLELPADATAEVVLPPKNLPDIFDIG